MRNGRDAHHVTALTLLQSVGDRQMMTSNHIRGEAWTFLRRRVGHAVAVGFLDTLRRSRRLEIVHVENEMEQRALVWLRRHDESDYSFVDATSFALMRSRKIREALAFNGDFSSAGFIQLRP